MKRIMIVDDEQDIKLLFEQRFRRELKAGEFEFCFVFSGEDAVRYLEEHDGSKFDLVLSDINMPGMSGLELLKIAKSKLPSLKVMMVTAYNDEDHYREALQNGSDDYFTKPVNFDELKIKLASMP